MCENETYCCPYCNAVLKVADRWGREMEQLKAELADVNPAIKCRKGCAVIKEMWGEEKSDSARSDEVPE